MLVEGTARGEVVFLDEPLSFWGGYDPKTGAIIDAAHPQHRSSLAGKIVVMDHGKGSSSSSAVLAESLRLGTGPAAIVLGEPDQIVVTGALVARLLYDVQCPVVVGVQLGPGEWQVSPSGVSPL
jgi:predicted aconitase with swiveling domain